MKNNQFKKFIRQKIEEECKALDFTCIYVDDTNRSRFIYVYTNDYTYCGTFYYWLSDKGIHLWFDYKMYCGIDPHYIDVKEDYKHLDNIMSKITDSFNLLDGLY